MATIRVTLYCQWLPHMALWSLKMLFKEAGATFWKTQNLFIPSNSSWNFNSILSGFFRDFQTGISFVYVFGDLPHRVEQRGKGGGETRLPLLVFGLAKLAYVEKKHTCLIFSLVCFTQIHAVLIQNTLRNQHRPFGNTLAFDIFFSK